MQVAAAALSAKVAHAAFILIINPDHGVQECAVAGLCYTPGYHALAQHVEDSRQAHHCQ